MKKKVAVLCGAGASVDAGLPNAFNLTEQVYNRLSVSKLPHAKLFAIVVSKIITRNAKSGKSPFDKVNIEEVYDGLKKIINKESDILSEFVTSWDNLGIDKNNFDEEKFVNDFKRIVSSRSLSRFDRQVGFSIDGARVRSIAKNINNAIDQGYQSNKTISLDLFLNVLCEQLKVEDQNISYMNEFLYKHKESFQCIATLNYDTVVERCFELNSDSFDYGLSSWNSRRVVRFHGKSPKLIKLHGSINWSLKNSDEIDIIEDINRAYAPHKAMIFGGQQDKLVPHGPFLHLRHSFQSLLNDSSYLIIVGYSFGDIHMNAIIRSWLATRKNGKLINVDPAGFQGRNELERYIYYSDKEKNFEKKLKLFR